MMRQTLYIIILYAILAAIIGCTTESDRMRMRAGLDSINVRNRSGQPFTVTDVQPYVTFFDKHGTPNDRLLAHYLLGLAYYDHGEAPMALQCYQNAAECADTTASDCDHSQLSRVYGQMAQIFYHQSLHRQQLEFGRQSIKYAWKSKDTLAALMIREAESFAYKEMGYSDSAIAVIEEVAKHFMALGYTKDAAITLGGNIRSLIDMGKYDKAKEYIYLYEAKSGFFDTHGNIESGREIYYNVKGHYFLHVNQLDSAEYYFRKELYNGKDFNNQHAAASGLSKLYQQLHLSDSVAKYSLYAYAMSDSLYSQKTAKEVERLQAMYDYTRHQEVAIRESERAALANRNLLICFIVLLAVLLLSSWLYIARKQVIENLRNTAAELNNIRGENSVLKRDAAANQQKISENEQRIAQLEKKLGKYGKLVYFSSDKAETNMKLSPNYQRIKDIAYKGVQLSEDDWDTIHNLIYEYLPGFYDFSISRLKINTTEHHICILLRLHFKAGEIANMLSVTPPYISKASTNILMNLYDKKGSSKELYKELTRIS